MTRKEGMERPEIRSLISMYISMYIKESCHTHECVISHRQINHVTHTTYEAAMERPGILS